MAAVRLAELERVTNFASSVVAPLSEVWSRKAGSTVLIESPQAEQVGAQELAEGLEGWYWVLPVEVTGLYSGGMSLLIQQSLVVKPRGRRGGKAGPSDEKSAGSFAGTIDEFLAAAGDRLAAGAGGPVTLDRLGLREVPGGEVTGILTEFLGRGELVAVSFTAEIGAKRAAGRARRGEVAVIFGERLARELGGTASHAAETQPPAAGPVRRAAPAVTRAASERSVLTRSVEFEEAPVDMDALLERASSLRLRVAADVGRKRLVIGEVLRLRPGSVIDLGKGLTEPLELRAGGKLIGAGDAVTVSTGLGLRIRG